MTTTRDEACSRLHFDPNKHPENMLKAFQELLQCFPLRWHTLPRPTKGLIWSSHRKVENQSGYTWKSITKPNLEQFDEMCEDTKLRDKIAKFLGMNSWSRLHTDWCMTVTTETARKSAKWNEFVTTMTQYYKPNWEHHSKTFSVPIKLTEKRSTICSIL